MACFFTTYPYPFEAVGPPIIVQILQWATLLHEKFFLKKFQDKILLTIIIIFNNIRKYVHDKMYLEEQNLKINITS